MFAGKTIFISPLDWGLGHATRCVPIIRDLKKNNKVILGVTSLTKKVFDEEFPDLEKINVPAYNILYSSILPLSVKLLSDWPRISGIIKEENKLVDQIISDHKIDVIISDNRFGMHSQKVHSVFMTHQLFLKSPFASSIAQNKNKKFILNFNEVWVPDFEDTTKSLSGELSHGNHFHTNVKYIGPQSRLTRINATETKYDYLFLLSGPQPQLSKLAVNLLKKAKENPALKFVIVSPEIHKSFSGNVDSFCSPDNQKLNQLISASKKIICRSGYSTLMDLHLLEKKEMILVPTPGQTEQEYLAEYWQQKFGATCVTQNQLKNLDLS